MKKSFNHHLSKYRKVYSLKLKDVAFLLKMDEANLSRFEAGKSKNFRALQGYHILFDLPEELCSRSLFKIDSKEMMHRCFQLLEKLNELPRTYRNRQRIEGLERLITKLNQ